MTTSTPAAPAVIRRRCRRCWTRAKVRSNASGTGSKPWRARSRMLLSSVIGQPELVSQRGLGAMDADAHRCRFDAQYAGRLADFEAEPLDEHQGLPLPEGQCPQHPRHLGARLDDLGRIDATTRTRPKNCWPPAAHDLFALQVQRNAIQVAACRVHGGNSVPALVDPSEGFLSQVLSLER